MTLATPTFCLVCQDGWPGVGVIAKHRGKGELAISASKSGDVNTASRAW